MRVHVFDAFGTLFDVHGPIDAHANSLGASASGLAGLWRAKQLEYTWVSNSLGIYESLDTLTVRALEFAIAHCGLEPEAREGLLEAYRHLPAFSDVATALAALRDRDETLLVFTNASESMTRALLRENDIEDLFAEVVSVEHVGRFKPDALAYALLDDWRTRAERLTFYSANRWDIAGASSFGLDTVWLNRRRAPDEYPGMPPRRTVANMNAIVRLLE